MNPERARVRRIGLVLGAGGVVGQAYHDGILSALEESGWDPRSADVVVGTSAGSQVGALLRSGLRPAALAARDPARPSRPEEGDPHRLLHFGRPSAPRLLARAVRRPRRARGAVLLTAALPAGTLPTDHIGEPIRARYGSTWPAEPLWICAVDLDEGERVVFGRTGAPEIDVPTAVEASSAVPALSRPVVIAGHRHVDGGIYSPTNLDLVAGLGLDLVVVSSPMSAASVPRRPDALTRAFSRRHLRRETARVTERGTPVLAFEPGAEVLDAMGSNMLDPKRRRPVVEAARAAAKARLADPAVREAAAVLLA